MERDKGERGVKGERKKIIVQRIEVDNCTCTSQIQS